MEFKRRRELLINIVHAKELSEAGLLKEYSLFLYLKSKYRNSCFYNYSQNRLSKEFGISRASAKKHIALFLKLGWCRMSAKHLIFNKLKSIDDNKEKRLIYLKISDNGKVKEIVYNLRLKILQSLQDSFNTLKTVGRDILHPKNSRTLTKAKKLLRRIGVKQSSLPAENDQLKISINKFSKMFNCSMTSAHNIISSFKKNGDVQCIGGLRKYIMKTNNPSLIKAALSKSGFYYRDGIIYQTSCNQYIF